MKCTEKQTSTESICPMKPSKIKEKSQNHSYFSASCFKNWKAVVWEFDGCNATIISEENLVLGKRKLLNIASFQDFGPRRVQW